MKSENQLFCFFFRTDGFFFALMQSKNELETFL